MKRNWKEMSWSYAIRNNPIQADPAPIVTDPGGSHTGSAKDFYDNAAQNTNDL